MILKWKTILKNWINCYTTEAEKGEHNITPENLLHIFTHIHESFRLDDSKSSKFEANTIQDFIIEKYPEFKFENGTLEATCEEEVYIVASLLLFFICVNSKNADIKRVMCSKLSVGDQETIMKFTKCLMDCSPILYADVEAAISEACGDVPNQIAETPPALRSLHGEVRRLQAALDAERFDRNYLQDELARTNLKLDKLTKIKEQYKLDILSLKAKISLCCGEQRESHREARADEFIGRLQRQLQDLEGRLEDTLGQLEDIQQERDSYKQKVADLKQERDKWLSLSQEEADKAGQLADQLDIERRSVASLRDLVSELRQHNRNNGLNSSMLECDDPDTSIQSLSNLSVCNEACANVIEVQLVEERAKIEILKQQIQSLQEQLCKASQTFESEKLSLEAVITEKENNLFSLKQRVDEGIQEKSNLKTCSEQEIDKLSKKLIEMSLMIKDVEESSKNALAEKVQEIQLLHKNYTDKTDTLGIEIQNLHKDIEEERTLKKQCEEEIVRLNNKIDEMLQTIKHLEESSIQVLSEKEQEMQSMKQQFANETEKSNDVIENLQKELNEQRNLRTRCEHEIVELKNKIVEMSQTLKDAELSSKHVLSEKEQKIRSLVEQFEVETEKSNNVIENLQKELNEEHNLRTRCEHEIVELRNKIVEMSQMLKDAELNSEHVLEEKEQKIHSLVEQFEVETEKSNNVIKNLQEKLNEQNNLKTGREHEIVELNNKIVEISQMLKDVELNSEHMLKEKEQQILTLKQQFATETEESSSLIENLEKKIKEQTNLKTQCEQEISKLNSKIAEITEVVNVVEENSKYFVKEKVQEIETLQQRLRHETEKSSTAIKSLQEEIEKHKNAKIHCEQEIVTLNNKIIEITQTINSLQEHSKHTLEEKMLEIQMLRQQLSDETEKSSNVIKDLQKVIEEQNHLKTHYEQDITALNSKVVTMTQKIQEVEESSKLAVDEKVQEIQSLQLCFEKQIEEQNKFKNHCEQEIVELNNRIIKMTQTIKDAEESSKLALEVKVQENVLLQKKFADETKKSEYTIESLNKELEAEKHTLLKLKEDFESRINILNDKVLHQNKELTDLNNVITQKSEMISQIQSDLTKEKQLKNELSTTCNQQMTELKEQKVSLESDFVELQKRLREKELFIDKFEKEVKNLKIYVSSLEEKCQNLAEENQKEVESHNQGIVSLNDKIVEMTKTIKNLQELSKRALEEKMQEMETLHQQFAADSGKSENIIKNLKIELEAEKYAQLKLKDDFDNRFMKLNEKVLNRNNELVELQNNIIQKSELIEVLQSDLRREKELRDELSNTCNNQLVTLNEQKNAIEINLQQKLHEITEIQKDLHKLQKEKENLRTTISSLEEKGRHRESIIKEKQKEIEFLNDIFQKEQEKLNHKIDERNASIKSLQMQLHNEIEYKVQLQRELSELQTSKTSLIEENEATNSLAKDYEEKILLMEKQIIDRNEQIQANVHKEAKLEDEKVLLVKEVESLKAAHREVINDREAKTLMWEKQKIDMNEEVQVYILKMEGLEEDKAMLLKEMEALKATQIEETNNHEAKMLAWEKQKIEFNEQMHANLQKVEKLENEKATLLKEMEVLKDSQSKVIRDHDEKMLMLEKLRDEKVMLMKEMEKLRTTRKEDTRTHEEKTLLWERHTNEMTEQIQSNILKIEKLEDEKAMLLKDVEELKALQIKESKNYEEKALRWEKQNIEMEKQIQVDVLKVEKLEDEKTILMREIEALKSAQTEKTQAHEEKARIWEKQKIEMEEQIKVLQQQVLKVEKLEEEKANFVKEIEAIRIAQNEETKAHEESALMWEKQKVEMEEQIKTHVLMLEKFEEEKMILIKEIETIKAAQSEQMKAHEESALFWDKQKVKMEEQIKANVLKLEELEEEKTTLIKEIETIKTAQSEDTKVHEENALMWEKQKIEMEEQIQANIFKLVKLENEVSTLREMEGLKTAQESEKKDQMNEMKGQIDASDLNVKKLDDEKAILFQELEQLKAAERIKTKDHEEKALLWEKEKTDMYEQLRAKDLKVKDLEEEKAMVLKKVGELMAAEMEEEICLKKNHEGKILMLEKQETELKDQIQANALRVEKLVEEKVILLKEVEALKAAQKEMLAAASQDKILGPKYTSWEKDMQGLHHQVDTTTSDLAHSSMESLKTISDLEKIVQDKNRKITVMQTEITYIKSMMAESGIKLIDVTKELEVSKDTCHELSSQLKKIVQQKNEEIAELKRQVAKMSATENRASQIIKVSAKYQAMILKRIAEIKSSAVLKELTNFGNQNSNDAELRRSLAGNVTMEDLENFLETTDRHLKRCTEKQIALQKDRDRLSEVNRINESEIINMKKFLTEMSVSFRTFTTVKEVYSQKLSKIVSLQRMARREILSLDGRITEATMCKLERGYAAVMQDLSECAMNLERWVDRSVSRLLSAEKIKQAFTSDLEQASLSTCNYQNAAVEVQLSELDNSFQKLLAEVDRAHKGEGAKTPQEVTIMEVRAEYEDKLNRMKAKMKELFNEEMGRLKQKQAEEIAILERELIKSKEKLVESSRAYEDHIRGLTTELWSVGEKFLVKQEEADWLRKKQSGSLMSLQHVHSSGLHPPQETFGRLSDTHSLRSFPTHNKKSEARGMHMSDEEGEVFDNRFLKELAATPRASLAPGQRISELKRRNSLVPPHLKSSYPAEMQFAPTLDEEDIKCAGTSFTLGRPQRKEVGITAYKKPGPPTPSKQAGRLSATDSELRESLRVEADPQAGRKTSTPSRIRSLFRSNRTEVDVGTPRSRRFSSIFRKK